MILTSVLSLAILGLFLAGLLAVASHFLSVEEDPRVEAITEALPGANCGGCGFAGCEAYAIAVLSSPDTPANLCTVGGASTAAIVGELAGKAVEQKEPTLCFRRCSREEGHVQKRYHYEGAMTCASAALLEGGPYMCSWSCIGFGDCVSVCQFDAIEIRNGLPEINPIKCVSCGACVKACPRDILTIIPVRARVMNVCATHDKLKAVSEVCEVGCINCLRCVKACPAKAITFENGRTEFNHEACLAYGPACNEACVDACGRKILHALCPRTPQQPKAAPASAPLQAETV